MISALIINDVPVECINHAATIYHVPALLIISVLKIENGKIGQANINTNGTFDLGPMQINSTWLPILISHGYSRTEIQYDAYKNVQAATWILATDIANGYSHVKA